MDDRLDDDMSDVDEVNDLEEEEQDLVAEQMFRGMRAALERKIEESKFSATRLVAADLVIMTVIPHLQEEFAKSPSFRIIFDLGGLDALLRDVAPHATLEDVHNCAHRIAEYLAQSHRLVNLSFFGINPSVTPILSAILSRCQKITDLALYFDAEVHMQEDDALIHEHEQHQLQWRETLLSIGGLTMLRHVVVENMDLLTYRMLVPVIVSSTELRHCRLKGPNDTSLLTVSAKADGRLLGQLAAMKSLVLFGLENIALDSDDAALALGEGLASSSFFRLCVGNWVMTESVERIIGKAIGVASVSDLEITSGWHLPQAMVHGLKCSSTIHKLMLGKVEEPYEADLLVPLLNNSQNWNISELTLSFTEASKTFEDGLASCIKSNDALRRLELNHSDNRTVPDINLESLAKAVDSGARSLESISCFRMVSPFELIELSTDRLKMIVQLNQYRHCYGYLFKASNISNEWLTALEKLDMPHLFYFLLRNEWDLQQLLAKYCTPETNDHGPL